MSEEGYKITVTLSKKGIDTLDMLKEVSGFGSRGRTIDEAILTIWEMTSLSESFLKEFLKMGEKGALDARALFPYIVGISTKLSRFGSPAKLKQKTG